MPTLTPTSYVIKNGPEFIKQSISLTLCTEISEQIVKLSTVISSVIIKLPNQSWLINFHTQTVLEFMCKYGTNRR